MTQRRGVALLILASVLILACGALLRWARAPEPVAQPARRLAERTARIETDSGEAAGDILEVMDRLGGSVLEQTVFSDEAGLDADASGRPAELSTAMRNRQIQYIRQLDLAASAAQPSQMEAGDGRPPGVELLPRADGPSVLYEAADRLELVARDLMTQAQHITAERVRSLSRSLLAEADALVRHQSPESDSAEAKPAAISRAAEAVGAIGRDLEQAAAP